MPDFPSGVKHYPMPGYIGDYYISFTDGSERLITLVGHLMDPSGRPIYLIDDEGWYYNFQNVIRTRKKVKDGG